MHVLLSQAIMGTELIHFQPLICEVDSKVTHCIFGYTIHQMLPLFNDTTYELPYTFPPITEIWDRKPLSGTSILFIVLV